VSIVFERTYLGARISFKTPDLIERHKNGHVVHPALFSARDGVSGCYVNDDREFARTLPIRLADPRTFSALSSLSLGMRNSGYGQFGKDNTRISDKAAGIQKR